MGFTGSMQTGDQKTQAPVQPTFSAKFAGVEVIVESLWGQIRGGRSAVRCSVCGS